MRTVGPPGVAAVAAPYALVAMLFFAAGAIADDPDVTSPADEIVSLALVGEVRFPHFFHAEELGFECSECHHETAAAGLASPHPAYLEECENDCAACHGEVAQSAPPQSCGDCHGAALVSTAAEALSAKVAIHRSCWSCHDSGTGEEAARNCRFCHDSGPTHEGESL